MSSPAKQTAQNTFTQGMIKDLNPLTTPNDVLTDCLNGTVITYNGNEFVLQNDQGNCKVERAKLSPGFIPMGMKYYGGIVYVASLNPETQECEIGSFPSPERDFSTSDFANLSPANFKNTDFIIDTGDDSIQERDTKIQKLFEPELFQLHPGDMYVVLYTLHTPATIDTDPEYNDYISEDPTDRKLFRLKFAKITDSNNLIDIDPGEIKVIPTAPDIEDEYVYFKQNSNSTIAVELGIEQLDYFDASVVDRSLKTDSNKKVGVEAIGFSDSLSTFEGIRLQVTQPVTGTYFLSRTSTNKKVQAILDGLSADDQFECSITPFSPYCLFPKLKKNFKLTIGKYLTSGSGVNNLFRYYDNGDFMKVDFDYKFEGDSPDGIHLYVEFYDPWSDYSIVKTVDNPTYYGINNVIIELVDEPRIDQFDSTTVGGTNPLKLITNPDTDYEKTLLNSTNLIRTDQTLRRNHFYIVRVSGVDKSYDATSGLFTYKHYDFYKGLYTTDMYNDIYQAQTGLSESDNGYIGDFNSLDFDLTGIKYNTNITQTSNIDLDPVVSIQRDDLMTNDKYYKISSTPLSTTVPYKYSKQYTNKKSYSIGLTLSDETNVFGDFKTNLLSLTSPTLQDSDGTDPSAEKPTIVDTNYDNNTNVQPESIAHWSITGSAGSYVLQADTSTKRSVYAPVDSTTQTGYLYELVSLASSFYYKSDSSGPFSNNRQATLFIEKYNLQVAKEDGTTYTHSLGTGNSPDDGSVRAAINAALTSRPYSAVLMTSDEPTWAYNPGYGDYWHACNDSPPYASWKKANMAIRNKNAGDFRMSKVIDVPTMVDFWNSLSVASNVNTTMNIYYPGTVTANGQINTVTTFPDLAFVSNFTPDSVSGSYVKTYLSRFRFHATGAYGDFNPTILNNWINARKSDSVILDNKLTIRDGFIPYITNVTHTTNAIPVPTTSINQAGDNSVVTAFTSGQTQYASDPSLQRGTLAHGDVTTSKPELYGSYASKLQSQNVFPGTAIVNTGHNAVYVQSTSSTQWFGYFARTGSCKGSGTCPTLDAEFDIPKI